MTLITRREVGRIRSTSLAIVISLHWPVLQMGGID